MSRATLRRPLRPSAAGRAALVALLPLVATTTAAGGGPTYAVEPIPGGLVGFHPPSYDAMNDVGGLVGHATNLNDQYGVAVSWQAGAVTTIGLFGGLNTARSDAVANTGDAVGRFLHTGDSSLDTSWLLRNGQLHDVESFLGDGAVAVDVGDGGEVLVETPAGTFLWSGPGGTLAPVLPGQDVDAFAIAPDGTVVGHARFGSKIMGFLWRNGTTLATIPSFGAPASEVFVSSAVDVNAAGEATGWVRAATPNGTQTHAFFHSNGQTTLVAGPGPEYAASRGEHLAGDGSVVVRAIRGAFPNSVVEWFLWKDGTFRPIVDLIGDSNLQLSWVDDVAADTRMLISVKNLAVPSFEQYLLTPVCPGGATSYGVGCAGAGGFVPALAIDGCPSGGETLNVSVTQARGGATAFLVVGLARAEVPMGSGCDLLAAPLLGGPVGPLPLGGAGAGQGSVTLPAVLPAGSQGTVTVQALVVDPASPTGHANSNGVELCVQ